MSNDREVKRCFNCGAKSHVSINCPSKDKGTTCFKCNAFGHVASKCTASGSASNATMLGTDSNATCSYQKKLCKDVYVGNCKLSALIDSGSDVSLVRVNEYVRFGAPKLSSSTIVFKGIGSEANVTLGETRTKISIDGTEHDIVLHVVPDNMLPYAMLIGNDFLYGLDVPIIEGNVSISKIKEVTSLPEVLQIDAFENANDVDLSHIENGELKEQVERV